MPNPYAPRRHSRPRSTLALWTISLFAALSLAAAAADPIQWDAVTEYPAATMPGQGLTTFAQAVANETKGEIVVTPKFDAPGGLKSVRIVEAVRDGKLAVGDAFAGALTTVDPIFQLPSLPFLATDEAQARTLYLSAKTAYADAFAKRGQRLLYATPWPATGLWSKQPIGDVEAIRRLSIRCYDAAGAAVFANAGANAMEMSFSEAMPKLKDGTFNAVLSSGDGGAGRKLWEFLPYFTEIGYAMPLSFTTVSLSAFEGLPPQQQASILRAAAWTEDAQWKAISARTAENYAVMKKNGVTIAKGTPEISQHLAKAAAAAIEVWERSAGPDAASLLAGFRRN